MIAGGVTGGFGSQEDDGGDLLGQAGKETMAGADGDVAAGAAGPSSSSASPPLPRAEKTLLEGDLVVYLEEVIQRLCCSDGPVMPHL